MSEQSMLEFSLEDGSNSTRQLRRFKTPEEVNAAVTWFLQGRQFGVNTNEAEWKDYRLGEFIANLAKLSSMLERPATVDEVYQIIFRQQDNLKSRLIMKPLKEFVPIKELELFEKA